MPILNPHYKGPHQLHSVAPQQSRSHAKTTHTETSNPTATPPKLFPSILRRLHSATTVHALPVIIGLTLAIVSVTAVQARKQAPHPRHGNIESQHGDWQIVCKPPPPGASKPVCAVVQSVTAEDRDNVGLTVYFQRFSDGTQVLRVFAPLGVLLPPGLGLKVDGKDLGNAPFLRCQSFACYAQVTADKNLVDTLRTGKTAIFIIFQTEEAGIGIPISLNGFAQAYDNLK